MCATRRRGERVDEVLAAYMPAPHSYTREDVVEIDSHGGPVPLQRILGLALREGARLAEPGEFTLRAFLHGRLDLAQAEAVLDVINARTQAGLRAAVDQLGGRLSGRVRELRAAAAARAGPPGSRDRLPGGRRAAVRRDAAAGAAAGRDRGAGRRRRERAC